MAVVVSPVLYLGCALSFLIVSALVVLRGSTSRVGTAIVGCCLLSAGWSAAAAFPGGIPDSLQAVLNSAESSGWLLLLVVLLARPSFGARRALILGAAALVIVTIGQDVDLLFVDPYGDERHPAQLLLRLSVGIAGLLAVENLWRNTGSERRWHIWPLCLAIGGLFAYDLFLFSDAFMNGTRIDPSLALGQPMVGILMAPLLTLAMARNREWRIDIHVSRQLVLHTATLIASGGFLIAVALAGMVVRRFGGDWGPLLQLAMLIGSLFVLAVVLSSESPRRRLGRLISRNLFSHRYDYRTEWLKFIDLVSGPAQTEQLQVRIIRALAEFVDSPSGVLWSLTPEIGYRPTAAWKLPARSDLHLSLQDRFIAGFRDGGWIQQHSPGTSAINWPSTDAAAWLAVPLSHGGELVGFVLLSRPKHQVNLDWESFDLLRAAGRQAASYLAEERSTRALLDATLLNEYAKRFAFVVHDIKNLASQLGLTVSNARRYLDDPDFRRDMLDTIENAAGRMHNLLSRLRADPGIQPEPPRLPPAGIIAGVASSFAPATIILEGGSACEDCTVAMEAEHLRSALTHLIQNAIDASPSGEPVTVRARRLPEALVIEVIDRGIGMDAEFIRDELFKPFRSTKSGGHGIGAYQTRELLRISGGKLDVISAKGVGTTMRMVLPLAATPDFAAASAGA